MMPAFLADECFSGFVLRALQDAGFDVVRSIDIIPGADDRAVLALAVLEGRVLLTEDTDFGELTMRLGLPAAGVVRVDLMALKRAARAERAVAPLRRLGEQVCGALVSIEPTRIRLRQLPAS
jgi:predicted nuclease of predicted toxin-antitoxin system